MGYKFNLGKAKTGSPYIPDVGEVVMYDDGSNWTTRVGDGKTQVKDLIPLPGYDVHKKVMELEKEIEQLKLIVFSCLK